MAVGNQGRGSALCLLCGFLLFSALLESCHGVVHDVPSWVLPAPSYVGWTRAKAFRRNDVLRFQYSTTYHNVLEVSASDYVNCVSRTRVLPNVAGVTSVKLTKPGYHYFICGVPGHCEAGMKIKVFVK